MLRLPLSWDIIPLSLLLSLEKRQNQVSQTNSLSEQQANEILERIKELNKKNILKQESYIVENVVYDEAKADKNSFQKFYFKDFKTILGDKLPKFTKAPFVLPVSNQGASIQILNVTSESFDLGLPAFLGINPSSLKNDKYTGTFYLVISEIP